MLKFLLPIFALALVGCSSADSSAPTNQDVSISSSGSTTTIDQPDGYNLNISGNNNTITIARANDINSINLSGSNNMITFEGQNDVITFNISGSDNTIIAQNEPSTNVTFTNDSGSGNTLTLQ